MLSYVLFYATTTIFAAPPLKILASVFSQLLRLLSTLSGRSPGKLVKGADF